MGLIEQEQLRLLQELRDLEIAARMQASAPVDGTVRRVLLRPGWKDEGGRRATVLDTASAAIAFAQGVPGDVGVFWESHDILTAERVGAVQNLTVDDAGALWVDLELWSPVSGDVSLSPSLLVNFEDAAGKPWPACVDHCALTRTPADPAQLREDWIS